MLFRDVLSYDTTVNQETLIDSSCIFAIPLSILTRDQGPLSVSLQLFCLHLSYSKGWDHGSELRQAF